jgi:Zn-dependent protease with chaperone function
MHEPLLHQIGDPLFDGAFRNLWPLIVVPALSALLSERTARLLPQTPRAWIPAALLTALPGLVALGALYPALTTWGDVLTWRGVVLLRLTPAVALAFLGYALVRAALRQREVARLFSAGTAPGERLARFARELGLRALELPTQERECFVAGVLRPTVFVSRGTLDRLGDAELSAALHHERAHVTGRDTLMLFALSLLRDLVPWGGSAALEAFQTAREAIADRQAAAHAGPLNLAAALVALARPGPSQAGVLPMARKDTLRWRMQALLDTGTDAPAAGPSWAKVGGGLALNIALVAWPIAQFQLMESFCAMM